MTIELKEGEWCLLDGHTPVELMGAPWEGVAPVNRETHYEIVDRDRLEPLPRSDPRHPEHRPEVEATGEGTVCPRVCKEAAGLLSGAFPWEETPEGHGYWKAITERLEAMANHGTLDGNPPYEPPRGWVEIDPEDEATWPTERDADSQGSVFAVLVDEGKETLVRPHWDYLQQQAHRHSRWRTVESVLREATA